MKDLLLNSAYFGFVISLAAYYVGSLIRKKWNYPLFNPLLIAMILVILVMVVFDIDYAYYEAGSRYLSYLLTPATVCLAIPLYQQLELLKKNLAAILVSILAGVIASAGSILLMSYLFGLTHAQYVTLIPKSITTAIAVPLTEELGGIPNITVAAIVITGISGNILGEMICKLFSVKNPISQGLALGTSSHAIGTAKALQMGEIQGAMSSLSVAVAGLLTVLFASFFAMML